MNSTRRTGKFLLALAAIFSFSACVTERTVTRNGQPVQQGLVVKRPIKEAVENSR